MLTRHYKHWIKTFTSFADAVEQSLLLPAAELNADAPDRVVDKLALLLCYLSPEIFDLIEESATYDEAKAILDQTFLKQKNATYARHLLFAREQKPGESVAEYSRALKSLAKDCDWRAVSAQEFQCELTRDEFITGITSSFIKQRLLEEDALTLDDVISKVEILERAQNQSRSLCGKPLQSPVSAACSSQSKTRQNKKRCYFCAGNMHPGGREECPAKDCYCRGCGKKRHFYKACRSSSKSLRAEIHDEKDDQMSSGDDAEAASSSPFRFRYLEYQTA